MAIRFATLAQWTRNASIVALNDVCVVVPEGATGSGAFPFKTGTGRLAFSGLAYAPNSAFFILPGGDVTVTNDFLTDTQLRATPVPVEVKLGAIPGVSTEARQHDGTQSSRLTDGTNFAHLTSVTGNYALDVNVVQTVGGGGGGGAVTIADGADVTLGAIADALIAAGATGTVSAKLRRLTTDLAAMNAKVPALGQALNAASVPVVLTASQLTTLTPPAAITGFATAANQTTEIASLGNLDVALSTRLKPADTLAAVTTVGTITNPVAVTGTFWQATQPVSGTFFQATQPVSGTFWQATQPVSIAGSIAVTGGLTDAQLRASAVPVDGSGVTQPISAAALPLPTGAATSALQTQPGVDIGDVTVNNAAGASAVNIQDGGNSLTVDGTFWQATQPVSVATAPVLVAGSAIIGKVGIDQTTPGTTNNVTVSSLTPPTLTKGTQGSTGFSVQNLRDAGRTSCFYSATAAAAGTTTTETAITLTASEGTAATSTGTSFTPTSGKTFRIQSIMVGCRGNTTATIQTTIFSLRLNAAGAVITSSTPVVFSFRITTPATQFAYDRIFFQIPEGYDIFGDGTLQWGITANATYTTNPPTWDVAIAGYRF